MNVIALDPGIDQWIAERVSLPRSAGQHVSTVLTKMLKALPVKKYETWGQQRPRNDVAEWEHGYAWEDVLSRALADRPVPGCHLLPPTELELDGIFGTPDRLLIEPTTDPNVACRVVNEEIKFTWMSCKSLLFDPTMRPTKAEDWNPLGLTDDVKFTYWLLQSRTYAAMLYKNQYAGLLGVPLTRIRALFINGAYRGDLALSAAFEIAYTAAELETWWTTFAEFAHQHANDEPLAADATPAF